MANETIRPGYTYKDDTLTANYEDNYVETPGVNTQLKIINNDAGDLEFVINSSDQSTEVHGIVKANESFKLEDMSIGVRSVGVRGSGTYRLWAYQ